jgi:AraC-like DNA-binding protein
VEAQPSVTLESWVVERAARHPVDSFGMRVLTLVHAGAPVAGMATRLDVSTRQLHRRCPATFGYGPRHLARVLRFGRALEAIRAGEPLAHVAAVCRYADQAHFTRELRALAGTTPSALRCEPYTEPSVANRSTGRPSGSKTTA